MIAENQLFLTHYFDPYDVIENDKISRMLSTLESLPILTTLYRDIL